MIHTFVRAEPRKIMEDWEEKLLAEIYEHWPRCTEQMTDKTATIIYNAIGSEVEDGLQHIKATYRKRRYSKNTKLRTADFAAKGFNPSEETLLKLMYKYWPRRIATLTSTCKEILTTTIEKKHPELAELARTRLSFVYIHRKFRRGEIKLPNKPGMTEEEETIIDNIYKHWPHDASGMNYHVAAFLSQELKLNTKTIKESFKSRRWSRHPFLQDMRIRTHAAVVAGRLDLLQYYIEQGDDINSKDSEGLTLLMVVCDSYFLKCFEYLLTHSTLDLTLTNSKGQNVMIYICANWSSSVSDKMQRLLQWNNSHGHPLDINGVDNAQKSMLYYACDTSKLATIKLIVKEPTLRINQSFFGKTILRSQCELQKRGVIRILLTHPNIEVSDSIGITNDRALVNTMIKKQIASQSSLGSGSRSSTPLDAKEECGHYSLDQGRSGICYILSVITLFRNAPEILEELKSKSSKTIRPIVKLLTEDYSTYDFSKQCPKIPPGLIQAITNNRVTRRGALTKNGGSAFTLLLYILNIIDNGTDISVRIYHENDQHMAEKQMTVTVQRRHQRFVASPYRLGYIDLGTHILLLSSFFDNLRVLMKQCLNICGFIFRVYGHGINHVIAASVCEDRSIHICNSWGKGCQTDFGEFVNGITDWGAKPLIIDNVAFLLYKNEGFTFKHYK